MAYTEHDLQAKGGITLLQVVQKSEWQKKHDAAWSYIGVAMHLYGIIDLDGHNGLGKFSVDKKKDKWIHGVIRETTVSRTYGGKPTQTQTYNEAYLDWKLIEGSIAFRESGLEAVLAAEGTIGLVTLLKKGRDLVKRVPKLGKEAEKQLDRFIKHLERSGVPKVEFTGNAFIHLGLDESDIPFYRIGVQSTAAVKIQQKKIDEILKKLGVPTSASTGGRSWQIDLRRVDAHFYKSIW
jgi:hypothetical protein